MSEVSRKREERRRGEKEKREAESSREERSYLAGEGAELPLPRLVREDS